MSTKTTTTKSKAVAKPKILTKQGYDLPEGEEQLVHAEICMKGFSPETGKRIHSPYVQKWTVQEWEMFLNYPNQFEVIEILSRPTGTAEKAEDTELGKRRAQKLKTVKG